MGTARIKSGNEISVFIVSHRKLRFISIVPGVFHPHNRFHDFIDHSRIKTADANQIIPDFFVFKKKLSFISHRLNLTAAALSVEVTPGFHSERGWNHNFFHPRISVIFLYFCNPCFYGITDNGVFYKQCISVRFSNAFSVIPYIFNLHRYNIVFPVFHSVIFPPCCRSTCLLGKPDFCLIQFCSDHIGIKEPVISEPSCLGRSI